MIKEICGKVSCDLCNIYFTSQYRLNSTNVIGEGFISECKPLPRLICKSLDQIPQSEPSH